MPWLWPIVAIAILVVLYFTFDRHRYRGRPHGQQRPTRETFLDPVTGRRMRVYEDSETGARSYREE